MANTLQESPKESTILLLLRIVILFFVIGGIGALAGTKLLICFNGETCLQGRTAGAVLLLTSALLAVPGIFLHRLCRHAAGRYDEPVLKTTV
jgi:hypothetical protein